eukprot:285765-Chlamydomonas_euryale.AAC.1
MPSHSRGQANVQTHAQAGTPMDACTSMHVHSQAHAQAGAFPAARMPSSTHKKAHAYSGSYKTARMHGRMLHACLLMLSESGVQTPTRMLVHPQPHKG